MNEVIVSVIIPTYMRHKEMLKRAVDSVLAQTFRDFEIIVIDDNGLAQLSDYRKETENLIASYSNEKIKYLQDETRLGGAGARNAGARIARGKYISFLDDDDVYLPEKLSSQYAYMTENNLEMSFSKLNIYNENEELIDVREHCITDFGKDYLIRYHLTKQITGTPTFMLTKELFDRISGFDIVFMGQEFYLMYKIIMSGARIGCCPGCQVRVYRTKAPCISNSAFKTTGERNLYRFKKQNFWRLNARERQYARCRHYAVMAVAYKRKGRYGRALLNLIVSVLCSPLNAFGEAVRLKKRCGRGALNDRVSPREKSGTSGNA